MSYHSPPSPQGPLQPSTPKREPTTPKVNRFSRVNKPMSKEWSLRFTQQQKRTYSQLSGRQFNTCSESALSLQSDKRIGLKQQQSSNKSRVKLNREQQSILCLDPSLEKLCRERGLDEKNVQIKYVNTLKKIKAASSRLGCQMRVQSSGFTLQNTKERQKQKQQTFSYNFGKQFNRYFKRKLVQKLTNCESANLSLHATMSKEVEKIQDTIKLNKKSHEYRNFTSCRMQTYIRGVSNEQKKLPFAVKQKLDRTFEKIEQLEELPQTNSRKVSEAQDSNFQGISPSESPTNRTSGGSRGTQLTKLNLLLSEYQADIAEFEQICDFFERIQHELLRYMPNNHLSNKVNNIISQVEHSTAIRRIYDQCNVDINQLTPPRIVAYLRKEEGILGSMNYIVNVIKLNISAERRKRFMDVQKVIGKYQQLTVSNVANIADKLKKIDNPEIKKSINEAIKKTDTSCRGLDPSYLSFVRQAQEQEFSAINAGKNRNIICEILKFESLMK